MYIDVPFSVDFSPARIVNDNPAITETDAALATRRSNVYLWDAHKQDAISGGHAYWPCDFMEGTIDTTFPMRSF